MLNKRLYFFTLFIVRAYTTKSLIWHHAVYNITMLLSSFTFFSPPMLVVILYAIIN